MYFPSCLFSLYFVVQVQYFVQKTEHLRADSSVLYFCGSCCCICAYFFPFLFVCVFLTVANEFKYRVQIQISANIKLITKCLYSVFIVTPCGYFCCVAFPPKNTFSFRAERASQTDSQSISAGDAELPYHRWIKLHVANRWVFSKQLRLHNYSSNSFLAAETFLPSTAKAQNELCK